MTQGFNLFGWLTCTVHSCRDRSVLASVRLLQRPKHVCIQCPRGEQTLHHFMTAEINGHMHHVISKSYAS